MKTNQKAYTVIGLLSLVIFIFLVWLIYFKPIPETSLGGIEYLPFLNALLNTITSIFLVTGFIAVKNKKIELHKKLMACATLTSALFLISYITYHHFHGDTKFQGIGGIRYIYFFILITHILLSIVQVPLILTTLFHAAKKNWQAHKKIAKITFPIWLYVSVTGVLVFVFLQIF